LGWFSFFFSFFSFPPSFPPFLFLVGLGFEFRASCLQKQALYCLSQATPPVHFVVVKMGSGELFVQVGLEL
jgi:hypothetical protein